MIWLWVIWSIVSGFFAGKMSADTDGAPVFLIALVIFNAIGGSIIHYYFGFGF